MHLSINSIIVFLALLLSAPSFAPAQKAVATFVSLEMQDENGDTLGRGSGFFVRPNLIATNFHVVDGAAKGYARLFDSVTTYPIERVMATDRSYDLALLKVIVPGVTPLQVGDSDAVQTGDTVIVAGNLHGAEVENAIRVVDKRPGFNISLAEATITGRRDRYSKLERLEMRGPIFSGGPVLNSKFEVIGMSTPFFIPIFCQDLNFAVPSNALTSLLLRPENTETLSPRIEPVVVDIYRYRMRAHGSFRLEDYDMAIGELAQLLLLNRNDAWGYHYRGVANAKLGRFDSAIVDYDKSVRINPRRYEAYLDRGNAKMSLNQFSDALADFSTAIRLAPNSAEAHRGQGDAKYGLERYPDSIADYDVAIRLKPDASAYIGRGNARRKLNKYNKAIADYNQAIYLDPNDARAYFGRGLARRGLHYSDAARRDFNRALQLATRAGDNSLKTNIEKELR